MTTIYLNVVAIGNETANIARPKLLPIVLEIVLLDIPVKDND